ncbi:hypothetical protein B0T14DRAFT_76378 [Immersiella caudata]|uniref:Uncharacterized protein n=1 Tax=Immersiella caudata TaxID=314043 RepID=A0AA40CCQ9_9PEZI|nr:hypothetical protein B0T14DRAFT_76378 [Immersiella caudata]
MKLVMVDFPVEGTWFWLAVLVSRAARPHQARVRRIPGYAWRSSSIMGIAQQKLSNSRLTATRALGARPRRFVGLSGHSRIDARREALSHPRGLLSCDLCYLWAVTVLCPSSPECILGTKQRCQV